MGSVVDVSYVGNHGYNRLGGSRAATSVNLNAVDFGTAYLPQNQDPTLGAQRRSWRECAADEPAAAVPRASATSTRTRPSSRTPITRIQSNFNRRFRNGFSFGVNYVLSLSFTGNTGLLQRLQHAPDGSISIRADQAAYEKLNKQLNLQRHLVKANWVWDLPDLKTGGRRPARSSAR